MIKLCAGDLRGFNESGLEEEDGKRVSLVPTAANLGGFRV